MRRSRAHWITDRRILITGASSGLGEAVALRAASDAGLVIPVARRSSRLRRLAREIDRVGGRSLPVVCDLSKPSDIGRLGEVVRGHTSGVDAIVNCGAHFFHGPALHETSVSDWDEMLRVNLTAPLLLCQEFVPGMMSRGSGRILNVISATNHVAGFGAYRVSKIGLEVLTQGLVEELSASGVFAAAFNPGWMRTEHSLSGKHPSQAAKAVLEVLGRPDRTFNGGVFDLVRASRKYAIRRRRRPSGIYGDSRDVTLPMSLLEAENRGLA